MRANSMRLPCFGHAHPTTWNTSATVSQGYLHTSRPMPDRNLKLWPDNGRMIATHETQAHGIPRIEQTASDRRL